jgi:O-antigen/teichoic acid export membrane protein
MNHSTKANQRAEELNGSTALAATPDADASGPDSRQPIESEVAAAVELSPASVAEKRSFLSDVLKLAWGTGSAQVLGILAALFTARLFSPSAFGVAALFASITNLVMIVSTLRYELAIMLPKQDEESANAAGLSVLFVLLISAAVGGLAWISGDLLPRLLKAPDLHRYLWLLPVNVFFGGLFSVLNRWNSRQKCFTRLMVVQIVNAACTVAAQVGFGLAGRNSGGYLIAAAILGLATSTSMLAMLTWHDNGRLFVDNLRWNLVVAALKRYRRFPKYSTAKALLDVVAWQMPVWFLSSGFSTAVVGRYALGTKLVHMPMNLIGNNVAIVFFQRAAKAKHEGRLAQAVESSFRCLAVLSLFPCLLVALTGKDLFVVSFGHTWAEAGVYAQILSVWICVWFLSSPLGMLLDVLEKQALHLRLSVLNVVTRFAALGLGMMTHSPRMMLALLAACGVVVYGYYGVRILNHSGLSPWKMLPIMTKILVRFVPAGIVIVALRYLGAPSIAMVAAAGVMVVAYYLYVLTAEPEVLGLAMARFISPRASVNKDTVHNSGQMAA